MKICKWAGDAGDEYCKNCDGVEMMVEGKSIPCNQCAGYEEGTEEVAGAGVTSEEVIEPPVEPNTTLEIPFEEDKVVNTTSEKKKPEKKENTKSQKATKVKEEKKLEENKVSTDDGVQVVALRYTSSATVKKGDNYYKFTAEEEWNVSKYAGNIDDVREQLWAKLNCEVDKQIEELSNM